MPLQTLRTFARPGHLVENASPTGGLYRPARYLMGMGLTAALLAGCDSSPLPAEKTTAAIPVKTVLVAQQDMARSTTQPASVHAFYQAEIYAKVSGYVGELHADIGDVVSQGATLATIQVPDLEAQARVLDSRVARAEAEVSRANSRVRLAQAQLASASAKLQQAESDGHRVDANLAAAESEFARTSDLVQRQSLQARMLDEALQRRDAELAAKSAAEANVVSANAMVAVSQAEVEASQADMEAALVDINIAKAQRDEGMALLQYATLKAPFDGVVTSRTLDPGDLVNEASATSQARPLMVISQVDKLRITIPIPEHIAASVQPGDQVSLSFPSFADEPPMQVSVTRLSSSLDPNTRSMLVECEVDNTSGKLLPGMFGQATITLSSQLAANVLPARAVRFSEQGDAYVYTLVGDTVAVVPVTTGTDNGTLIEIRQGLEPGQQIVDSHLRRFLGGEKVQILTD